MILFTRRYEFDEIIFTDGSVHDLIISYDTSERIENRVKYQSLKRSLRISLWSRNPLHNSFKNLIDPHTGFATRTYDLLMVATEQINNLVFHLFGLCAVKIALVYHRYNLQIIVNSHIEIGDGLSLDALRCIHDKESTLAGCNRA